MKPKQLDKLIRQLSRQAEQRKNGKYQDPTLIGKELDKADEEAAQEFKELAKREF